MEDGVTTTIRSTGKQINRDDNEKWFILPPGIGPISKRRPCSQKIPNHFARRSPVTPKFSWSCRRSQQKTRLITTRIPGLFPFLLPTLFSARIVAIRCSARASPWFAARTYQLWASTGSGWHPSPISVKYPTAYCAFGRSTLRG